MKPFSPNISIGDQITVSHQDEIRSIDREYFEETELFEMIPHQSLEVSDSAGRADNK